jgi:DHA3 family tetracycline resistance protein-like MFS transporter
MILEGSFPVFHSILMAQLCWGIGYTFTSGALDAWLVGEIGESNLPPVYLRGSQAAQVSAFVGIFAASGIANLGLNLPYFVGGGGMLLLAAFLVMAMPENHFRPARLEERSTLANMAATLKSGLTEIKKGPLLVTVMLIAFVAGLYSEPLDRLWEAHLLENFAFPDVSGMTAVYWFGLINATKTILSVGAIEVVRRRRMGVDQRSAVRLLFLQNLLLIVSLGMFGLASSFGAAVSAYHAVIVVRRTGGPVFSAWINRGIEPSVRATVLSTISQMDAVGQVAGGPVLGVIASRFGLRAAMVSAAVTLSPVLILLRRAANQPPAKNQLVAAIDS